MKALPSELAPKGWLRGAALVASILPYAGALHNRVHGDTHVYERAANALFAGQSLYADVPFEYPPYALPWFFLPRLLSADLGYHHVFAYEMLLVDIAIKLLLLSLGRRRFVGLAAWLPFALFSVTGWCLEYIYLKRFDLVPALFALLALLAVDRRRHFLAALWLALGAGSKLYPLLFVPAFFFLAFRRADARRFALGLGVGALPALALAFIMPWWSFVAFHRGRPLQVESIYAALIWLLHFVGVPAEWQQTATSTDLGGPVATAVLPYARAVFFAATSGASLFSAASLTKDASIAEVAKAMLFAVSCFVVSSTVLSPQYMIWLMPLVAIAYGRERGVLWFLAALALTPMIFPSPHYGDGLGLPLTVLLVLRDGLLVAASVHLFLQLRRTRAVVLAPTPRT